MFTPIVLMSLGMAVAVASGSLADHAELITNRNLAADRAERAAAAFVDSCGSSGCDSSQVDTTRSNGTVLTACRHQATGTTVLRVKASVGWTPRVLTGLSPASAISAVDLGGFATSATAVLSQC